MWVRVFIGEGPGGRVRWYPAHVALPMIADGRAEKAEQPAAEAAVLEPPENAMAPRPHPRPAPRGKRKKKGRRR